MAGPELHDTTLFFFTFPRKLSLSHIHRHTNIYTSKYVCICIYTYTHTHTYVYMYQTIQTCTHTYIDSHILFSLFLNWLNVLIEKKKVRVLLAQSCLTLWDPMDCSTPGSSVHGILQTRILQARVLEPFPSPWDLPDPGMTPGLPHCRQILYSLSHQGRKRPGQILTYGVMVKE